MGKFIATSCLIGCIFFVGVFFGATLSEDDVQRKSPQINTESISGAYEKWQVKQAEEKQAKSKDHMNEKNTATENNVYSETAKSFSNVLKNVSRTVVFHILSIFEKMIE